MSHCLNYIKKSTTTVPTYRQYVTPTKLSGAECHALNHDLGRAIRIHDYHKALKILNEMKDQRVLIEPAQYAMVIRLYCDEEMLDGADKLFARMDPGDIIQGNVIIHAHCRKGDLQGAMTIFKKMKSSGIGHDQQTYHEIIRLLAKGKELSRIQEMLHKMDLEGIVPSSATYIDVMYCFATCRKYKEAIDLYRNMQRNEIKPESITYNLVLEIATLAKDKELIDELIHEMWTENVNIHPLFFEPIHKLDVDAHKFSKKNNEKEKIKE